MATFHVGGQEGGASVGIGGGNGVEDTQGGGRAMGLRVEGEKGVSDRDMGEEEARTEGVRVKLRAGAVGAQARAGGERGREGEVIRGQVERRMDSREEV